ncbi:MAG: hypothetical protein GWN00_31770 [Aliifodinibius sp.]|nr:hypothetical protein [Fodinibius sp.]NIV10682.1 hypothetical protein [Fodinibius sp.]NIY29200.1 hypothetical protein [Fodinibius sp.]
MKPVSAQWYVHYVGALEAIKADEWQNAVNNLNAAIAEKPNPQASARTDELYYLDYLPLLYRSIANYHLRKFEQAEQDLLYCKSFGEIDKARVDKNAQNLLQRYLILLNKRKEINHIFEEGKELLREQNYPKAKTMFQRTLVLDSAHAEARKLLKVAESKILLQTLFMKAKSQLQQSLFSEALVNLKRIKKLDPSHPGIEDMIARTQGLAKAQKKPPIIKDSDKQNNQKRIETLVMDGINLFNRNRLEQAEAKFNQVLTLANYDSRAVRYLYLIRQKRANQFKELDSQETSIAKLLKEAIEDYKSGDYCRAKKKLLGLREKTSDHADVKQYLALISQIEREMNIALRAFAESDFDSSISTLTALAARHDHISQIHAWLGCAYAAKFFYFGENDKHLFQLAVASFRRAKALEPNCSITEAIFSPKLIELFNKS